MWPSLKINLMLGTVVHAYNPSTQEVGRQISVSSSPALSMSSRAARDTKEEPVLKINKLL